MADRDLGKTQKNISTDMLNQGFIDKLSSKVAIRKSLHESLSKGDALRWLGVTLNIGWNLTLPVILAVLVDRSLSNIEAYVSQPLYAAAIILLGFMCGLYGVYREMSKTLQHLNAKTKATNVTKEVK